ncbi:similar to Saccharomyces cerevisiae YNL078W NIS1 Protein localized in the bud neck at G2/M phase [Maudiozyma barnettii]|uniref:Similar to Saccharomyces cerevisiae YNL078W NIS1 Protein localized in the bud neck at G2/M phase n=1 Tax=Maudiozyma barnettii TaxID=61262 RepID=A0A8H2ZFQ1_9SACH|nr:Nis1p [Kazachstania barnettii]CAB4252559.1 similar to Saccharomyces cerevisiae YNL078W NIS1 Protein localized in the bud neck at G2/M phase [Kazachstania barnettii]CAD1779297.1 similar to Saccharomyces cerevisiae YNL078W NIS1 Protein localized in the bud neck at G2/M phase [Kazachstania barnettii]
MIHRHGYQRVSSQESALSQVSNWDRYQQLQQMKQTSGSNTSINNSKEREKINIQPFDNNNNNNNSNGHGIKRRHSSRRHRHKDFTTQTELNNLQKKNNFLFPRGFITLKKRNNNKTKNQIKTNSRYRNYNELNEMMNLIDLKTLDTEQILPLPRISIYNVNGQNAMTAQIRSSSTVPRNIYKRQPSIKRVYIPMTETQLRLLHLKRSNTMPTQQRRYQHQRTYMKNASKKHQEEEEEEKRSQRQLRSLWEQYLRAIIHQRIQLRLELMKAQSVTSLQSRDNNPEFIAMMRSKKGDNKDNPIIIPDDLSFDSKRKMY